MILNMTGSGNIIKAFDAIALRHPVLNGDEYADIASDAKAGRFSCMLDMYSSIIARGVGRQIRQGLYRDYIRVREDLPVMHGSLDISGTIRNRLNRKYLISCESDNLSVNNTHNQVLKAVMLYLLRRDEVNRLTRAEIKKQVLAFDGIDDINPGYVSHKTLANSRCNVTYQMLMDVCGLVMNADP